MSDAQRERATGFGAGWWWTKACCWVGLDLLGRKKVEAFDKLGKESECSRRVDLGWCGRGKAGNAWSCVWAMFRLA